jgi:predicted transcriptional regulator
MSNTETAQLITRMPVSLRRELKHLATDRNTSMSVVVRDAIVRMVGEAQRAEDGSRG